MKDEITLHVRALRRYALVLTRDAEDAEDLVQETLIRALTRAALFAPGRDLRVWLFAILHNAHVSRGRRHRSFLAVADKLASRLDCPPAQVAYTELREVLEALQRLPADQREAILLVSLESLPYAEAAKILRIPVGTLMSRLSRGRDALRGLMDGEAARPSRQTPSPGRVRRG
jgi:RNA polymerase sigma-70 factor (ECF subfamily)